MKAGVVVLKQWLSRLLSPVPAQENSSVVTQAAMSPAKTEVETSSSPFFAVKKGGKEIASKLFTAMSSDKGIHLESLLSALGALAGYACQISVREALVVQQGRAENEVFIVVNSKRDGQTYFFGDLLNKPLAESRYSVWSLASGASQKNGLQNLIDLHAIFKHVTDSLGSGTFGVPRTPTPHQANELPVNYVRFLWPQLFPLAKSFSATPTDWPILFGVAIQEILYASKDLIDPQLALSIVMESAVPMSKIYLSESASG